MQCDNPQPILPYDSVKQEEEFRFYDFKVEAVAL